MGYFFRQTVDSIHYSACLLVAGLTVWETVQFHAGLYKTQADPTKPDVSPEKQRLQQAKALLQLMGLQKTMHTQVMHSFHLAPEKVLYAAAGLQGLACLATYIHRRIRNIKLFLLPCMIAWLIVTDNMLSCPCLRGGHLWQLARKLSATKMSFPKNFSQAMWQ